VRPEFALQAETNRFPQLAELQISFPQPAKDSVGLLAELRCAEAVIDEAASGFAYSIGLRGGLLQLRLEGCSIKPGVRPDDLIGARSRKGTVKVSEKNTATTKVGMKGGIAASLRKLGLTAFAKASISSTRTATRSRRSDHTAVEEKSFVQALPGSLWRIVPESGRVLDRTYLVDEILCKLENIADSASVGVTFHALAKDIMVTEIHDGVLIHVLKHFSFNKMRIAALLVAKDLATGPAPDAMNLVSAITFSSVLYAHDAPSYALPPRREAFGQIGAIKRLLALKRNDFAKLVQVAGLRPERDFCDADLSGIDFAGADLDGFDFSGANLRCADFRQARIGSARFDGADLHGALWDRGGPLIPAAADWVSKAPDPRRSAYSKYMQEIGRFPVMTTEQEYMLGKRFQEHQDPEAAAHLYTSHLRTAAALADKWLLEGLSFADVLAVANAGLVEAIAAFDPDKGVTLAKAARPYMRLRLADYILARTDLLADASNPEALYRLRRKLQSMRRSATSLGA